MIDFLIVEDNNDKYDAVTNFITKSSNSTFIRRSESVTDATKMIKASQYTFLILDIDIPIFDNEVAVSNGGVEILKWLKLNKRKKKCKVPLNIIVLSEYKELVDEYKNEFEDSRVFAYIYSDSDITWQHQLKEAIDDQLLRMEDAVEKKESKKIVFSVHGINTYGEWQKKFHSFLTDKDDNIKHFPYNYSFYPVLSFLIPPLRKLEVNNFKKQLEFITTRYPSATVSIVGHSFGTYLVAKSLEDIDLSSSPKFERIILCGSVLKSNYNWRKVLDRHEISDILNDCALNDGALIFSQLAAVRLGMAGRTGFKGSYAGLVTNRFFKGGHSSFFIQSIFEDWLSFLNDKPYIEYDEREPIALFDSLVNSLILYSPCFLLLGLIVGLISLI